MKTRQKRTALEEAWFKPKRGMLPCPFCGGLDLIVELCVAPFCVKCESCEANGPACYTSEDNEMKIKKSWNKRK